jgi:hypothetical protein
MRAGSWTGREIKYVMQMSPDKKSCELESITVVYRNSKGNLPEAHLDSARCREALNRPNNKGVSNAIFAERQICDRVYNHFLDLNPRRATIVGEESPQAKGAASVGQ